MDNNILNVLDFGAKAVDGFDNTDAFQAAVDKAVAMGGATVLIPSSNQWPNRYWCSRPVYINGDRVAIRGEGEDATTIQTWGPAFIVAKHPRLWETRNNSYLDTDTNQIVKLKNDKNEFVFEDRYKMDLMKFTANGIYKSSNPLVPSLDLSQSPLRLYGIRPRGVVKSVSCGNLLATGGKTGWESREQLTFDFITYAHDKPIEGGVAGCGEWSEPDPWLFSGDSTHFSFCIALTDDSLVNKAIGRIKFTQPQTLGLHRISIQLDFINQKFAVFVDQKQVEFTFNFDNGVNPNLLFTKFNRMARWEYADFTIGSRCRQTHLNEIDRPQPSDYTVIAVKCYSSVRYNVNTVSSNQTKIDGTPLNDGDSLNLKNENTFAGLFTYEPIGNVVNVVGDQTHFSYGTLLPVGYGSTPISGCKISDMKIQGVGHLPLSDGITLGSYLHLSISNVAIQEGFFHSIGSFHGVVSYPLYMNNCKLYSCISYFGVNQSHIMARNITFGYIVRCAIKLVGSGSVWQGGMTNDFEMYAEAFFLGYNYGVGAGHRFEDIMIDTEGVRNSPRVAYFYTQKTPHVNNNGLYLNQVSVGESGGVPIIYLDDKHTYLNFPSFFSATNCSFGGQGKICKVVGTDWQGSIDVLRHWCPETVIEADSPYCKVTSVHKDCVGPPNQGGYSVGCHNFLMPNYITGGVKSWVCSKSGLEGSENPPNWTPDNLNFAHMAMSGNVFSNFYASGKVNHAVSGQANIKFGTIQDKATSKILDFILNNKPMDFVQTHNQFCVDPRLSSKNEYVFEGERRSSYILNNRDLWNDFNSLNCTKTNKSSIILNIKNADSWHDYPYVITRPACLFLLSNGINIQQYRAECMVAARFENQKSIFFRNDNIVIPPNGLILGFNGRENGWTSYAEGQIMNFLFGNVPMQLPSTFFLGLSRTPVFSDISTAKEPTGYRRIEVTRSSNSFAKDSVGSTFYNNIPLSFGNPQGRAASLALGFVKYFFLADDKNNVWFSGALNRSFTHTAIDPMPSFAAGALQIQL